MLQINQGLVSTRLVKVFGKEMSQETTDKNIAGVRFGPFMPQSAFAKCRKNLYLFVIIFSNAELSAVLRPLTCSCDPRIHGTNDYHLQ